MGPGFPSTSKMWLKTMQKRSQETILSGAQPFSAEQGESLVSRGSGHPGTPTGHASAGAGQAREEFHAVTPVSLPQQPGDGWESSPARTVHRIIGRRVA